MNPSAAMAKGRKPVPTHFSDRCRSRAACLCLAGAFVFATSGPSSRASGRSPAPQISADLGEAVERGRDPLGLVRTAIRPRVWILLDTSRSMLRSLDGRSRFRAALEVIRSVVDSLESDAGEPLVHWRLASFQPFVQSKDGVSRGVTCSDPTMGAGLPLGSPPGPPQTSRIRCGGARVLADTGGCNAEQGRTALLRALPSTVNASRTPNGIALHQLASHIAATSLDDLEPGQKNIVLLITDGLDTCECVFHPWLDFHEGPPGRGSAHEVRLRTRQGSAEELAYRDPSREAIVAWNAGLKARAAHLALNAGDPNAGLGDIHVVGVAMSEAEARRYTNHLAWMASDLKHPAIHADRPETLRNALDQVLGEVTLPPGQVKLGAPRLATVKELVASSPSSGFRGNDPSLDDDALVADPSDPGQMHEALGLRSSYRDNVLVATGAELERLRGHLRAVPTQPGGGALGEQPPVWDAGLRLAQRDPDDRTVLFNRPGGGGLRPFRVGEVSAADLGVGAGYLRELDGAGARTAEDAAEIVIRLVRGEELAIHPDTRTIYGPGGRLHFGGGRGTWKLREGLAAPAVVTNPPRHPERVLRNRDSYQQFYEDHVNRRTVVYLPTSGGLLHAFAGDTGDEIFAYIPDDVLGPAPGEGAPGRPLLRELALAGVPEAAGLRRGLWKRFALAGSPVARDVFLPGRGEWGTVLSFGRAVGGRFLTGLDVSEVGDGWRGGHQAPRPPPGGPGLPRLLFNVGNRGAMSEKTLRGLGETPEPLVVEVPAEKGGEWLAFLPAGSGSRGDGSGEWLLAFSIEDGGVRSRFRVPSATSPAIQKNGTPTPAAPWRPVWGAAGAVDLVTRLYLGDLHGQIHRLDLDAPDAWEWGVAHRLGGEHPILTPLVVFPFPGRSDPHLLVVSGGDRRVPHAPAEVVLLRDTRNALEEVWRRRLADGELPQGKPVVLTDGNRVEVVLATRRVERSTLSCDVETTSDGLSQLHAFDGLTGAPLAGVVDPAASMVGFGRGRIRGISLSSSANLALSVSGAAGEVLDTVIGDFTFRVADRALEPVTLFVEGFRRSPF